MSVKSQQVTKAAMAKGTAAAHGLKSRVRGFAGNHARLRQRGARETFARIGDEASFLPQAPGERHKCGNEAHAPLAGVQKKSFHVSSPGDGFEREADEIARKVVVGKSVKIHEARVAVSRKGEGAVETTAEFRSQLASSKASGYALDDSTRSEMETRMQTDLSGVRVHAGNEAHRMNESISAKAFTHGQHVYFKSGHYEPSSTAGKELLAHELVHTQQRSSNEMLHRQHDPGGNPELTKLRNYDEYERARARLRDEAGITNLQKEIDAAINEKGSHQPNEKITAERKRQEAIEKLKLLIDKQEKRISDQKASYIKKLKTSGVKKDDEQDPFQATTPAKVNKQKFKEELIELYLGLDRLVEKYQRINAEIRSDKEALLDRNQLQAVTKYELTLPGVSPAKGLSTTTPEERADKLLKWAEIDARTSSAKYEKLTEAEIRKTTLEESQAKQKKFQAKLKTLSDQVAELATPGEHKRGTAEIAQLDETLKALMSGDEEVKRKPEETVVPLETNETIETKKIRQQEFDLKAKALIERLMKPGEHKDIHSSEEAFSTLHEEYGDLFGSKKLEPVAIDSFATSKQLIQTRLSDQKAGSYSLEDARLILKYYLKGSLKEDDRYQLLRFLSQSVPNQMITQIFGYAESGDTSGMLDPALLIAALESYDLTNDERRAYFKKRRKDHRAAIQKIISLYLNDRTRAGRMEARVPFPLPRLFYRKRLDFKSAGKVPIGEFQNLEHYKNELVTELKQMKAAHESNVAKRKDNTLTPYNELDEQARRGFGAKGWRRLLHTFGKAVQEQTPKEFIVPFSNPNSYIHASKLQKAINDSTDAQLPALVEDAWTYYSANVSERQAKQMGSPGKLDHSQFVTKYSSRDAIQSMLIHTVNQSILQGGKVKQLSDTGKDLMNQGTDIFLKTALSSLHGNERLKYLQTIVDKLPQKAWDPALGKILISALGASALTLDILRGVNKKSGNVGQSLVPLMVIDLSGKKTFRDSTYQVYGKTIKEERTLSWDTKREDNPPALDQFNKMYNADSNHPFFSGKASSIPGLFLGGTFSTARSEQIKGEEKKKFDFTGTLRFHYVPGSKAAPQPDQQSRLAQASLLYARRDKLDWGSLRQGWNKFAKLDEMNKLLYAAPKEDMVNSWLRVNATYKQDKFTASGAANLGMYNMLAANSMYGGDLSGSVGLSNVKLGKYTKFGMGTSVSGSATSSSPWTASMTNSLDLQWKTISLALKRTDDLNRADEFSTYEAKLQAELPSHLLGGYGSIKVQAILTRMAKDGFTDATFFPGGAVIFTIGGGGSGFRRNPPKR